MASSWRVFWQQFKQNFHTTGAVAPSSVYLARELCRFLRPQEHATGGPPRRVLEVGPGTGAVTRVILQHLGPGQQLDLVEINPQFVQFLQHALEHDPRLRRQDVPVYLHQGSILEWWPGQPYDVVISGLPLNNFEPEEVSAFLAHFAHLSGKQGVVSFFQYVGVRRLRGALARRPTRRRLQGVAQVLRWHLKRYEIRRSLIWRNLPPAWVHHLRFAGADQTSTSTGSPCWS